MMYEEKELMWQMERKELQQTIDLLKKEIRAMREDLSMFQKDKCNKQNTPSSTRPFLLLTHLLATHLPPSSLLGASKLRFDPLTIICLDKEKR
jgi:hypothetical protein